MTRRISRWAHSLLLLSIAVSGLPGRAHAVDVDPPRFELNISQDQPTQGNFQIKNNSDKTVNVRIQAAPYRFLQTGVTMPSAHPWISCEPDQLSLAPMASTSISFTITPPANLAQDTAGEYVASLLVDELPAQTHPSDQGTAQISIVPRFAVPVYLMVKGKEIVEVEIKNVSIKEGPQPETLLVETTVANQGTIHVRLAGTIAVMSPNGTGARTTPLGRTLPIFPKSSLQIPTILASPQPGHYKAVVTVQVSPDRLIQKEISFQISQDNEVRQ